MLTNFANDFNNLRTITNCSDVSLLAYRSNGRHTVIIKETTFEQTADTLLKIREYCFGIISKYSKELKYMQKEICSSLLTCRKISDYAGTQRVFKNTHKNLIAFLRSNARKLLLPHCEEELITKDLIALKDLFYKKVLQEQKCYIQGLMDSTGQRVEPHLAYSLSLLLKIKAKNFDLSDPIELKNKYFAFMLAKEAPGSLSLQAFEHLPFLKNRTGNLPVWFQSIFFDKLKECFTIQDTLDTAKSLLCYLEKLQYTPNVRDLLHYLKGTIGLVKDGEATGREYRFVLLELWELGEHELVMEMISEKRGYVCENAFKKTFSNLMIANYLSELPYKNIKQHVNEIRRDFEELRQMADLLPKDFWKNWIDNWPGLFKLWQTARNTLVSCAGVCLSGDPFHGIYQGSKAKGDSLIYRKLFILAEDSTLLIKQLMSLFFLNPILRTAVRYLLNEFDAPRIKQLGSFVSRYIERLRVNKGQEVELSRNFRRFIYWLHQSPGLALPLLKMDENHFFVIDQLLNLHGNCIKITSQEIETIFEQCGLSEFHKSLYRQTVSIKAYDFIQNRIYSEESLLVPSIDFLLSFNTTFQVDDMNSLLCPLEAGELEIIHNLYKLENDAIVSLIRYYFQVPSLQVLNRFISIFQFCTDLGKQSLDYICANPEHHIQIYELFVVIGGKPLFDLLCHFPQFLPQFVSSVHLPKAFLAKAHEWLFINPLMVANWFNLAQYRQGRLLSVLKENIILIPTKLLNQWILDIELRIHSLEVLTYDNVQSFVKLYLTLPLDDFKKILSAASDCPTLLQPIAKVFELSKEYAESKHLASGLTHILGLLNKETAKSNKIISALSHQLQLISASPQSFPYHVALLDGFIQTILNKKHEIAARLSDLILDGYSYIVNEYFYWLSGKTCLFQEPWKQQALDMAFNVFFADTNFLRIYIDLIAEDKFEVVQQIIKSVKGDIIGKKWTRMAECYHKSYDILYNYCVKAIAAKEQTCREKAVLEWMREGHFAFASNVIKNNIKYWEFYSPPRELLEVFFQLPEEVLACHPDLKPLLLNMLQKSRFDEVEELICALHYLRDKDSESFRLAIKDFSLENVHKAFKESWTHPYLILDDALKYVNQLKFSSNIEKERAFETQFSLAAGTVILLANGAICPLTAKITLKYLEEKLPFPKRSSHYAFLTAFLRRLLANAAEYSARLVQAMSGISENSDNPIFPMLKKIFDLREDKPVSQYMIMLAILSAQMTRVRQEPHTESCFGTQTAIETQANHCHLLGTLDDYIHLIRDGSLTRLDRTVQPETTIEYKAIVCERDYKEIIDHPLSRAREYTIARMCTEKMRYYLLKEAFSLLSPTGKKEASMSIYAKLKEIVVPLVRDGKWEETIVFLLEALKRVFANASEVAYLPDMKMSHRLATGAWVLVNKKENKRILNPEDYGRFLNRVALDTPSYLKDNYPQLADKIDLYETILIKLSEVFTSGFLSLLLESRREFYGVLDPLKSYKSLGSMPWVYFEGGYNDEVQAIYFEKECLPEFFTFSASNCEELIKYLEKYINFLPSRILKQIYNEPTYLLPMSFNEHSAMLTLHPWLKIFIEANSMVRPLLNAGKMVRSQILDKELKEEIVCELVQELTLLSSREKDRLIAHIKKQILYVNGINTFCSLTAKNIENYLGSSSEVEAKAYIFENVMCRHLRKAGFDLPEALPVIDYNWSAEKHSNYYLGFRASIWSGKIERYITFDGLPDIAIPKDFAPDLTEDNLWELPLFVTK